MTTMTDFQALALTAGEQAAVAAVGMAGQDASSSLDSIKQELVLAKTKLARISANMGAGANKTKLDAMMTALT